MMRNKGGSLLLTAGLLLIAAAFSLWGYNIYEGKRAAVSAQKLLAQVAEQIPDIEAALPENVSPTNETAVDNQPGLALPDADVPGYVLNPNMEMPLLEVDGIVYIGLLQIPALDLELPIINELSSAFLKKAPCRYSGSAYTGDLILAGHNYAAHFGKLQSLRQDDTVIFTDIDGTRFVYQVIEVESLPDTAVNEMAEGQWDLTLFTCNYARDRRIAVRCEMVRQR